MTKPLPKRRYRGPQGTIYLLHFSRPYKHAMHYVGFTASSLQERLAEHEQGRGARLMEVVIAAGITFRLARELQGDRYDERRLKNRGGAKKHCPICKEMADASVALATAWQEPKQRRSA